MSKKVPSSAEIGILKNDFTAFYNSYRILRGFALLIDQGNFHEAANEFLEIEPCNSDTYLDFLMTSQAIAIYAGISILVDRDWRFLNDDVDEDIYGIYFRSSDKVRLIFEHARGWRFDEAYHELIVLIEHLKMDVYFNKQSPNAQKLLLEKIVHYRMHTDSSVDIKEIEETYIRPYKLDKSWLIEILNSHSDYSCIIDGAAGIAEINERAHGAMDNGYNEEIDCGYRFRLREEADPNESLMALKRDEVKL